MLNIKMYHFILPHTYTYMEGEINILHISDFDLKCNGPI